MTFKHGTNYGYQHKHCRCEECRAWWNAWSRTYRKRRMARTGERMVDGKFVARPA